jgi:ATP-dependent DNA helicase RecG
LLAFGQGGSPQEIIAPTVKIGITQYPGSTKVDEADLSNTYIDNQEFGGNVLSQFEKAFAFIKSKLPIHGTIDSTGIRRDYLVIPEVAIREALANAIAHRDYSSYASLIQVDIYSNRLEIINPGQSLVPIGQLDTAPSATRNPLLMNFLKEHGITDQKARGIRTIKIALKQAGLLEPRFENVSQSFKVTLFASAFISPQDREWLSQFDSFKLNIRQLNALAHARNSSDGISNGEYRDINSMTSVRDDKKANKELAQLVELGVVQPVGDRKMRRYTIVPKSLE